jgi:outer membrane lipoprotein
MIMNKIARCLFLLIVSAGLLSACTTVPEQLKGEYGPISPETTTENDLQTEVRWGGVILETRPEADHTCFEILARKLESSMRPANTDKSTGRFVACRPGFYDPEVFKKNREVTLTGPVIYIDVRKVGEYDYHFPVVDIEFISLWPKRINRVYVGGYRPYYWHYPHYGRFYRYPYW